MTRSFVLIAALLSFTAFADEDAGVVSADAGVVAAVAPQPILVPVVADMDGGVKLDVQAELSMVKTVFTSVKEGNWWLAAGALLVLVVSLIRSVGKKFHEWLPDDNILDKPLLFLYDTKIGGWVLNWLTALAGGIGAAMAAGVAVDFSLWKSVVMVSTSGTALFELWDDLSIWWKNRKAATPATAPAPVAAPPADPPAPGV